MWSEHAARIGSVSALTAAGAGRTAPRHVVERSRACRPETVSPEAEHVPLPEWLQESLADQRPARTTRFAPSTSSCSGESPRCGCASPMSGLAPLRVAGRAFAAGPSAGRDAERLQHVAARASGPSRGRRGGACLRVFHVATCCHEGRDFVMKSLFCWPTISPWCALRLGAAASSRHSLRSRSLCGARRPTASIPVASFASTHALVALLDLLCLFPYLYFFQVTSSLAERARRSICL